MYELIKINDTIWAYQITMDDGDAVRFFVLDCADEVLVIDSGVLPVDVKQLALDAAKKSPDTKVTLINTHGDMDHTGGNASFASFYMHPEDYERCKIKERCPDAGLLAIQDGELLTIGSRTLQFVTTPGHTYGSVTILDLTNRIAFPGDVIQTGNIYMFGDHRCPDKMEESLLKLENVKERFDTIYSCHGKISLSTDSIGQVLEDWRKVLKKELPYQRITVFGTDVNRYQGTFCNFLYNPVK